MPKLVVFLDDGGVMNDNERRSKQWQRLVGVYLTPRLGGTPAAWAQANRTVTYTIFEPAAWKARLEGAPNFSSFARDYLRDWLQGMCAAVGVACPCDDECVDVAQRASAWIARRVDAAFPGAIETIRLLHARGYRLLTASGAVSTDLANYLDAMGVRECFERLYGPDLVDTFKTGPEYYERVLADAGVAPAGAVVVDDSMTVLKWASEVGMHTVLVGAPQNEKGISGTIASLANLPEAIAHLEAMCTGATSSQSPMEA